MTYEILENPNPIRDIFLKEHVNTESFNPQELMWQHLNKEVEEVSIDKA